MRIPIVMMLVYSQAACSTPAATVQADAPKGKLRRIGARAGNNRGKYAGR